LLEESSFIKLTSYVSIYEYHLKSLRFAKAFLLLMKDLANRYSNEELISRFSHYHLIMSGILAAHALSSAEIVAEIVDWIFASILPRCSTTYNELTNYSFKLLVFSLYYHPGELSSYIEILTTINQLFERFPKNCCYVLVKGLETNSSSPNIELDEANIFQIFDATLQVVLTAPASSAAAPHQISSLVRQIIRCAYLVLNNITKVSVSASKQEDAFHRDLIIHSALELLQGTVFQCINSSTIALATANFDQIMHQYIDCLRLIKALIEADEHIDPIADDGRTVVTSVKVERTGSARVTPRMNDTSAVIDTLALFETPQPIIDADGYAPSTARSSHTDPASMSSIRILVSSLVLFSITIAYHPT
jgi:hypothetical protein